MHPFRASPRARDRRTPPYARARDQTRTNTHLGGRLGGHGRGEDRGHGERTGRAGGEVPRARLAVALDRVRTANAAINGR